MTSPCLGTKNCSYSHPREGIVIDKNPPEYFPRRMDAIIFAREIRPDKQHWWNTYSTNQGSSLFHKLNTEDLDFRVICGMLGVFLNPFDFF